MAWLRCAPALGSPRPTKPVFLRPPPRGTRNLGSPRTSSCPRQSRFRRAHHGRACSPLAPAALPGRPKSTHQPAQRRHHISGTTPHDPPWGKRVPFGARRPFTLPESGSVRQVSLPRGPPGPLRSQQSSMDTYRAEHLCHTYVVCRYLVPTLLHPLAPSPPHLVVPRSVVATGDQGVSLGLVKDGADAVVRTCGAVDIAPEDLPCGDARAAGGAVVRNK
jgi:hypothetical protein